jgi:hypothetical protein
MRQHTGDQTMRTTTTTEQQQFYLDQSTGERGFGELTWNIVEPGKLVRADTQVGSYGLELQPDGKTYQLTFNSESESRICPTKFQAVNRAQWEADDHHRRLLAQQQQPNRLKPPKW